MKTTNTEITVDIVVEKKGQVLLIMRGKDPFKGKWALPGGFVETDERVIAAAIRELEEETAVTVQEEELEFIRFFDDPDRDPRGRVISFAHGINLAADADVQAGDDAAQASWFSWTDLPELAFDHGEILNSWRSIRDE